MYDVAIIGAGPAGASAAIYCAKAGKKTILFDNDKGMTRMALINNHYGVEQIKGPDMIEIGKKQATHFGAQLIDGTVDHIQKQDNHFTIEAGEQSYEAGQVIITTGASTSLAEKIGVAMKDGTEPHIKKVIIVDEEGRSNIEGIWAAGTMAGVSVHTIITAGDGAKVAINLLSQLEGKRYVDHDVLPKNE